MKSTGQASTESDLSRLAKDIATHPALPAAAARLLTDARTELPQSAQREQVRRARDRCAEGRLVTSTPSKP